MLCAMQGLKTQDRFDEEAHPGQASHDSLLHLKHSPHFFVFFATGFVINVILVARAIAKILFWHWSRRQSSLI